jgi:hypothetical protein
MDPGSTPPDYGIVFAMGGASLIAVVGLVIAYLKTRPRK